MLAGSACTPHGTLTASGFTHVESLYQVASQGGQFGQADRWRVANFEPGTSNIKAPFESVQALELDLDDDGSWDFVWKGFDVDLVLEALSDSGRLVFASWPLTPVEAMKKLEWHAERLVDSMSGTRAVSRFAGGGLVTLEKRFGAKLVSAEQVTVAGRPAHRAIVEIVDLDRADAGDTNAGFRLALTVAYLPQRWPRASFGARDAGHYLARRRIQPEAMTFLWVASCANQNNGAEATFADCAHVMDSVRFVGSE